MEKNRIKRALHSLIDRMDYKLQSYPGCYANGATSDRNSHKASWFK